MVNSYCPKCKKETEGTIDTQNGNISCEKCGTVIEEGTIINEVTFSEETNLKGGSNSILGQFVGENASLTKHFRTVPGTQIDSRELTLDKAKKRLQLLASKLSIAETLVDAAHRFFNLALQHNFTKGRRAMVVAAACLYISCRLEKTPHMLLDFSEQLQEDVYIVGSCFTKLLKELKLELPVVEPWLYIRRFAAQLEFGNKTNIVVTTALKLISRMKRDWIQIGRRPAGLCASSLIISARIHGFRRTQEEIASKN